MSIMAERVSKKIAFIGSSCVGKTALIDLYKAKYSNDNRVAFVNEAAPTYFINNPEADRFSEATQGNIQDLALDQESKKQRHGLLRTFCDRSVIDAPAYLLAYGNKEGSKRLLEKASFWLPSYDSLLLLNPADIPYKKDQIRTEEPEIREQLHEGFVTLLNDNDIRYQLISGTLAQRVRQVDEIAEMKLLND